MPQTIKHDQIFVVDSKRWFLLLRLFLSLLLSGSALAFLKASTFNHASIAAYGVLSIVYFAYNFMTGHHSERFGRRIVMAQLGSELMVEGLLVNHVGGSFSPYILFFIISIVISALYFHLYGSIATATFAGLLYSLPVAFDLSFLYKGLIEAPRFAGMGISSDEAFYTVFLHLCLFYFFAFISGYLAQKLFVTSLELKRLRLETGEILEQMRSGLLTVDDERRIVYFNRAAGTILGVDPEGGRGRLLEDVLGENQAELVMRVTEALRSMRAEDRSEIIVKSDTGETIPLGLSLSVIRGDSKNLRGVIAVFQDLTEAKKLEERMRTSDRLAVIGKLAAGIAHEIRNPLASIFGSVEVLKDELRPDGENHRLMQLILKESSRLNTILSDFLNFARVDNSRVGRCDLGVVIPEVVDLVRGHDEICDSVKITYKVHRPVLMIAGGEDQIRQILWNLILNSAQAMGDSGGIIRVYTEDYVSGESGDMIKLVVSDDGPGISSGIKNKIFDPFYSTKQGGTGLGLPIVVRIMDRLGGRTELETSEGSGTSFSIYIPRQVVKEKPIVPQEVI